jgi:hypothetical protein
VVEFEANEAVVTLAATLLQELKGLGRARDASEALAPSKP